MEILTTKQLMAYLPDKPNPETIRLWVKEKKIPALPREPNSSIFFYKESIDFWLEYGRPKQGGLTDLEYSKIGLK